MSQIVWSNDPLTGTDTDIGLYIREIQQNCNDRRQDASLGLAQWSNASVGEKFRLEHLEEVKTQLEDPALLQYYSKASITAILGHPWTSHPIDVNNKLKMGSFAIINDIRRVIDGLVTSFIYVADTQNHRIVRTSINGNNWLALGTQGSGTKQFDSPTGIDINSVTKDIYIVDQDNNRVVQTDINGSVWVTLGGFSKAEAISFLRSNGRIYVADTLNSRIVEATMSGSVFNAFGTEGSGTDQFDWPEGIHHAADGYIYVGDTQNNRIVKTDINGGGWTVFGSAGSGVNQFDLPTGIYKAADGYIYVADSANNRVVKTDINGGTWQTLGSLGAGNNQFNQPEGLYVDENTGYIYVSDNGNHRVVQMTMSGFVNTYGSNGSGVGQFQNPDGIVFK